MLLMSRDAAYFILNKGVASKMTESTFSSVSNQQPLETLIMEEPFMAEALALSQLAQAEVKGDEAAQFIATLQLAKVAWHLTEYEKGIHYCVRAEKLILPEFESQHLAALYCLYAQQYLGLGYFRSAHRFWHKAMTIALLNGQVTYQIEALLGIGNTWHDNQQDDLAYSALSLALTLSEQKKENTLAGRSAILLANNLFRLKQYTLMLEMTNKAAAFLSGHVDLAWQAEIDELKSTAYAHLDRLDEAASYADRSYSRQVENGKRWMLSKALLNVAIIKIACGKMDRARDKLKLAESIALEYQQNEVLTRIYLHLFELSKAAGNIQRALIFYKKYRRFDICLLKHRSLSCGLDQCLLTQAVLDNKALHLIRRLESGMQEGKEDISPLFRDDKVWLYECARLQVSSHHAVFVSHYLIKKKLIRYYHCLNQCVSLPTLSQYHPISRLSYFVTFLTHRLR